ncbi:GNAT family N-acetyltransferase [Vibrio coralliilyticus]|nr:GNAT family N-acetyltransferase [Vibrio coralliilyticus]
MEYSKSISELITPLTDKYVCPTCEESFRTVLLGSMAPDKIREYQESDYRYHVAEKSDGTIVGVIGMREETHLYHLFVSDDYQGQGLSRKLWETAMSDAKTRVEVTSFTVNSAVNAEHVYLNFGFKRINGVRNRCGMVDIPMKLTLESN